MSARPDAIGAIAPMSDDDLYAAGAATLLASWEEYTRGSVGAVLQHRPGVAAAVFPSDPEREFFNNAVLDRDLGPGERVAAVDAMEAIYVSAGVESFAAWVHERDGGMRAELTRRGYSVVDSTRAMGMSLADLAAGSSEIRVELGPPDWSEYLRIIGVPGLFGDADPSAFHILVGRLAGENVAAAMAFDHDGDCGIFNVNTFEAARRRGLGTALTAGHLRDAVARGCTTASLQASPMAEGVYAALGFRDLGRILELER